MAFIDLNSDVGAVLHDEDAVAANMARPATEGAVVMSAAVRRELDAAGVGIRSFV